MKTYWILVTLFFFSNIGLAQVQEEPVPVAEAVTLIADPDQDRFDFALQQLHKAAAETTEWKKNSSYKSAATKFLNHLEKFPNSKNRQATTYYLGYSYAKSARLNDAKIVYKRLILDYKEGEFVIKAARYLAYNAEISKDYKTAVKYYNLVADISKDKAEIGEVSVRSAICYTELKDKNGASAAYQRVLANSPPSGRYYQQSKFNLGELSLNKKQYEKAKNHFMELDAIDVDKKIRDEAIFFSGLCYYYLNQYEQSIAQYNKVLKLTDSNRKGEAFVAIISVKYVQEKYKEVISLARESTIRLSKGLEAKSEVLVGQAYLKMREYRFAIDAFNKVIALYPNSPEAFESTYRRILCYYNLKSRLVGDQVNQFITKFGTRYSSHTFMHRALLLQAETYYEAKNYSTALKVYNQIKFNLVGEENVPTLRLKKAWCYSELKQHRSAVDSFTDFLKYHPNDLNKPQVLASRAKNYYSLGDTRNALKDYQQVIKEVPKTELAALCIQGSARIHKDLKDYDAMIASYEQLLAENDELQPDIVLNAYYWCSLGNFKKERFKEATEYSVKCLKLDKGAYAKRLALIDVLSYYQLKDKVGLKNSLQRAIELNITDDIPQGVFRWLGTQSYKAGEFVDAETFLGYGVDKAQPDTTPAYFWSIYAKSQYKNKHYQWALQSITHAINLEADESNRVNSELYKALCEYGLSKSELAKQTANTALKKNPSGKTKAMLLKLLGDIHFNIQEFEQAAIYFASITEFYEDKDILPYSIAMIIRSLEASGKPSDALIFRKRLKGEFPDYDLDSF